MPHGSVARPKRAKQLEFGRVDIIPRKVSAQPCKEKAPAVPQLYKLRRSPTPLLGLSDLREATEAHLTQLNAVWKEGDLPNFDADSRRIAASFQGRDYFD